MGCFYCLLGIVIHLHCEALSGRFRRVQLNLRREHSPVHFTVDRAILSAVTSSLNVADTVPHACAITLPPPCLTDDVICFWLWAVLPVLHSFLFPSRSSQFFCCCCWLLEVHECNQGFAHTSLCFHSWKHLTAFDYRLWQRHASLHKSVLGNNSVIQAACRVFCFLLTPFILLKDVPECLATCKRFCYVCNIFIEYFWPNDGFLHMSLVPYIEISRVKLLNTSYNIKQL